MDFLNVIIGFSLAIWVLIGIRMHASWIAGTFLSEIEKIDFQQYRIEKYGYESISVAKSLKPQRVLVYGYWGSLKSPWMVRSNQKEVRLSLV